MSSDSSQGKVVLVSVGRLSLFSPGSVSVLEPSPQSVEVEGLCRVSVHLKFGSGDSRLIARRAARKPILFLLLAASRRTLDGGLEFLTVALVCGRPLVGLSADEAERPVPAGSSVWGRGRALSAPVMVVLVLT